MGLFTVDGVSYNVRVPPGGLKRSFDVQDGPNKGQMMAGNIVRDVRGTFYNYQLDIDSTLSNPEEYDRLFEALSAPVDSHTVSFPYGQSTLTFEAYITKGGDSLKRMHKSGNYWGGLSVQFVAMSPQRT